MERKELTILLLFSAIVLAMSFSGLSATSNCYSYSTQPTCVSNQCYWKTVESIYSWCEGLSCPIADANQTLCLAWNKSVNGTVKGVTYTVDFTCAWELRGSNLCDISGSGSGGGSFTGSQCSNYDGHQNLCYSSYYCNWNASANLCQEPSGGFQETNYINPSCSVVQNQATCTNISGCSWGNSQCSGNSGGIQCSNLNKSVCEDCTFLATCCAWNGTACKTSFDQSCYNNIPALASGKGYCEDFLAYKNRTVCEELSGSPFFMPCIFNQSGDGACHFNSQSFGSAGSFGEINTELGCEAQGGTWKTEQYTTSALGAINTDSWCDFKFGNDYGGGNCNSACWACESGFTSSNTTAQARSKCESSDLGYCEFQADSYAPNTLGWCNPKHEFVEGGGKSCDQDCSGCDYLTDPEQECTDSQKACTWVNDSSSSNGVGNCFGDSEKRCSNDCFSCYSQADCATKGKGGAGACNYINNICQPTGFTGELCFDGKDNDADTKIDCLDSDCASDKFCGGDDLGDSFGDCPSFTTNASCAIAGCVWTLDSFDAHFGGAGGGRCDFPGAQCMRFNANQTGCNATTGCSFTKLANNFCMQNDSLFEGCFRQINQSNCQNIAGCGWTNDTYSKFGRCEPLPFSQCFGNSTRQQNASACVQNVTFAGTSAQVCRWSNSTYSTHGGFCESFCFGAAATQQACELSSAGLCQLQVGFCEASIFGGKCFEADGNITKCNGELNRTCSYGIDSYANNGKNGTAGNVSGWCDGKGKQGFVNFIGDIEPVIIGTDENESGIDDRWDIEGVGIRDEFDRVMIGTRLLEKLSSSGICNGIPKYGTTGVGVSGTANHTFFWYLDADGNTTNNCAAIKNDTQAGFEFAFKYIGEYTNSLTETKVSYRCVNGTWTATPIPLISDRQKMCDLAGGGIAGIDKKEMFKFKGLYNKSANLRVYVTVGNSTANETIVVDAGGPYYYSQGAVDFKFEDCGTPGADADGDGITSSNDPDCSKFLKFGFVPSEAGFQCMDGTDNDGDGLTDCADLGCSYDFSCGGTGIPIASSSDKTAPKITWLQANAFPDAAFVNYDTDEPANGTITFYHNDSTCKTINDTVRDVGAYDPSVPDYKLWHDGPLDALASNPESLKTILANGTNFYYKTTVCDVSGNCAVSACLNFTTKASASSCKSCSTTFNFPFTPPTGSVITDALGGLNFTMSFQDGSTSTLGANSQSGTQLNYSQTKNFNLVIDNKKSSTSNWSVTFINASVNGKLSSSVSNFSSSGKGGDMSHNSTANGTYVGLGTTKCQELINAFRPKKLRLGIPGNVSSLYQCNDALTNCTLKSIGTNATSLGYNTTANFTLWEVPAEWGC